LREIKGRDGVDAACCVEGSHAGHVVATGCILASGIVHKIVVDVVATGVIYTDAVTAVVAEAP